MALMVKVKGTHPILHRIRVRHVSWGKKEKNQKRKVIQELGQMMAHNREKYKMLFYCDSLMDKNILLLCRHLFYL